MTLTCIGDLAFVHVQLCNHPACIRGPVLIRGQCLKEEIQYMNRKCNLLVCNSLVGRTKCLHLDSFMIVS